MREPNYHEALSHSWQMVKDHKILWIFGLLSACLGQWGLANFLGGLNLAGLNEFVPDYRWLTIGKLLLIVGGVSVKSTLLVAWLMFIGGAVLAVIIFVAVVSRGALIAAVGHWFAKGGKVSSTLAWDHGVKNFWKILSLSILTYAAETALLFVAVVIFKLCDSTLAGFVAQAFVGAIILTLGLMVEVVLIFASGYVVIDGASVPAAVARAWKLFTRHVLISLELGIILVFLSFVVVLIVLLAGFLVFAPAFLVWMVAILVGSDALLSYGVILANSLFILVFALAAAIFNAFNTSAWMYIFVKMHRESYHGWLLGRIKKIFVK